MIFTRGPCDDHHVYVKAAPHAYVAIQGAQEGDLMGIAPTGRQVSFKMIGISRIVDGKVEEWEVASSD